MEIATWVIGGAVVGFFWSVVFVSEEKRNYLLDTVIGIIGGVLGGFLLRIFYSQDISLYGQIGLYSVFATIVGAGLSEWIKGSWFTKGHA